MEDVPADVAQIASALRALYPAGDVPPGDYWAVLTILSDDMADEWLARVMADLTGGEPIVIDNDIAEAVAARRAVPEDVERVRTALLDAGWVPGEP